MRDFNPITLIAVAPNAKWPTPQITP